MTPEARFWSFVLVGGLDECWPWLGGLSVRGGYGRHTYRGRREGAHRIAYRLARGPLPAPLGALHHCDNPPCCNPVHLHAGTDADNVADMVSRRRHCFGERNGHAKLTAEIAAAALSSQLPDADIAAVVGASPGAIAAVRRGASWRHVTGLAVGSKHPRKIVNRPRGVGHHLGRLTHCKRGHEFMGAA